MVGTSEALSLGKSLGLEPKVLSEIMKLSSGNNWSLEKYNPCPGVMEGVPASQDYKGGFSVKLMLKDLGLAYQALEKHKKISPLGRQVCKIYKDHLEKGYENKDFSHIFRSV